MASYQEILDQIEQKKKSDQSEIQKMRRAAEQQRKAELSGIIQQIRGLMKQYDLSVEDLGMRKARRTKTVKAKGIVKYRNPADGKGWTGKGRKPQWVVDALARGKSLSDFAI